ncbi:MAG: YraN family protein [Clostridiales bacterium]|nr:YraN family protein [Clostridiales bacterium]
MSHSPQDVHKKVLGKKGEKIVCQYLKDRGYVLLERNFRTPFGEADIIVLDKQTDETVFVEVKTRTSDLFGAPREAITADKRRRYFQIAKFYGLKKREEPNARFDVAEVDGEGNVDYYQNAF